MAWGRDIWTAVEQQRGRQSSATGPGLQGLGASKSLGRSWGAFGAGISSPWIWGLGGSQHHGGDGPGALGVGGR